MSGIEDTTTHSSGSEPADTASTGRVAAIGAWVIGQLRLLVMCFSAGIAVVLASARPMTWRSTVRAEFLCQCHLIGTRAIPIISLTGIIVGLGMVYQALYWLNIFGQSGFAGRFLVLVLVREIAPLLVGLIVIGRSGSFMLVELGSMKVDGQVHMLDAQGIDPFLYLVVPRVLAVSVSMFCLTIILLLVSLTVGFLVCSALKATDFTLKMFIVDVLSAMGPGEFMILPMKTLLIGFAVGVIACLTGLSVTGMATEVQESLPLGMVRSVLATFLISSAITLLF